MSRSRSRAAKMRTSIPWGRAAAAATTLAVAAGPLAALVPAPRVAEAFVTPDLFFAASSSSATATAAAAKPHRGWPSTRGPAVMFTGSPAVATAAALPLSGGGGRSSAWAHYAVPAAAAAARGGVYLGAGDNPTEGHLSLAARNTASFVGGWGAGMKCEAGRGRRCSPEPLRSSVSGGAGDDMLPESVELPARGVDGGARADEGEEKEEDDGSWSDAEVERRVAERRVSKDDPYAVDEEEEEEDLDAEVYEEIVANMTKPLGITIEASTDQAELIYITSVGQQAEDAGLAVGDLLTGVSAVFGNDVWSVKGKNIEKVRSLVRCRTEPFILVRVERGHVSLEERCSEGFGIVEDADCWRLTEDGECEVEYTNLWSKVYKEEREVLTGGEGAAGAAAGGGQKKKTNEPPPPRDIPGLGSSFSGDQWGGSDY